MQIPTGPITEKQEAAIRQALKKTDLPDTTTYLWPSNIFTVKPVSESYIQGVTAQSEPEIYIPEPCSECGVATQPFGCECFDEDVDGYEHETIEVSHKALVCQDTSLGGEVFHLANVLKDRLNDPSGHLYSYWVTSYEHPMTKNVRLTVFAKPRASGS